MGFISSVITFLFVVFIVIPIICFVIIPIIGCICVGGAYFHVKAKEQVQKDILAELKKSNSNKLK